ncbi:MAG TPA: M1 family metallopeptidase [Propionibacteriaceae bacterium]
MSSVDPRPFVLPPHRPHPVAYAFAIVMPLVMLVLFAAPVGVVWALNRFRPATVGSTTPPPVDPNATEGSSGVGDPYYPDAGNGGYDVARYQISLTWDPTKAAITATTTISARATHELRSFYLDLALQTDRVTVDGQPASFDQEGFQNVRVVPTAPVPAGRDFQVVVDYSGQPGKLKHGDVSGWFTTNQEWSAIGEPESAAWWFPSNDHPSDPALMDVSVRVPAGMEAISVGSLESRDTGSEKDFDTWHWIARQPMATYLNFVSIGQYEIKQGIDDGLPYVYAVSEQLAADQRVRAFATLQRSLPTVRSLETMYGPYPFTEIGGVVPAHRLWFGALENQTRPVYNANSILDEGFGPEVVTHELAHMWFGDNVTVAQWNDIFNSEAYASWSQWALEERTGGTTADEKLSSTFDQYSSNPGFWAVTMVDPTRAHLFDAVYERGPMTLQALRNVIGDEPFFALARDWAQSPGTRTVEDWMAMAQTKTTVDLGPFFQTWMYAPTVPERNAANGFRS